MSCPHVSGIVGLLKTPYPKWSPATIRSAIMTTAVSLDNKRESILNWNLKKATPFDYGAGHVPPIQILDPGLVYDLGPYDYVNYLCGQGYNTTLVRVFTNEAYTCPPKVSISTFNDPSITVPDLCTAVTGHVTNVRSPGKYIARVKTPAGVSVQVRPSEVVVGKAGEEKEFKVVFKIGWAWASEREVCVWKSGLVGRQALCKKPSCREGAVKTFRREEKQNIKGKGRS